MTSLIIVKSTLSNNVEKTIHVYLLSFYISTMDKDIKMLHQWAPNLLFLNFISRVGLVESRTCYCEGTEDVVLFFFVLSNIVRKYFRFIYFSIFLFTNYYCQDIRWVHVKNNTPSIVGRFATISNSSENISLLENCISFYSSKCKFCIISVINRDNYRNNRCMEANPQSEGGKHREQPQVWHLLLYR